MRKLLNEVGFNLFRISVCKTIVVLINRTDRFLELSSSNSSFEFFLSRLHKGAMEGTAYGKHKCTLSTSLFKKRTSLFDGFFVARYNKLSRTVVVGRYNQFIVFTYLLANIFHFLVRQGNDSCHSARFYLASSLHGLSTSSHKFKTIFKAKATSCCKCRKFTKRMTCYHVRIETFSQAESFNNTVNIYCRLRHFCLFQFLICSIKHDVCDAETENLISFLEELFGNGMLLVEIFTHTNKLCTLARKNKCFHLDYFLLLDICTQS